MIQNWMEYLVFQNSTKISHFENKYINLGGEERMLGN